MQIEEQRRRLRDTVLAARDGLSPARRREKSGAIHAALAGLDAVRRARVIMVYLHFRSEVETLPALAAHLPAGCRLAVPLTRVKGKRLEVFQLTDPDRQLRPGYCGIPEPDPAASQPQEPGEIDLVLVPGSVFDRRGGRLGYGGGYYDRFLAQQAPQAVRIGLAFDLQVVDSLPLLPHDQQLHHLVTESGVIR
ncbi:5-formyltetrahydrofolate cyclo-ligase [Desulfurivibrio alkaliphilus]|uniref:5-formyltetrahydrofolate cyclo-ligase n=1 Tax=Desulfurivibrio alkaliphilus (strain DSM 19089 / UNIQEM U267 / AHT2) TaxID=589865 RepID=D6Z421_DESAT|nr:5-formyltetrahydrofolate cyclo-ligase [Desulfurivibrio alkaliphilus]ADH86296.1 5-formyltetrahydrofolate cyclo-ligase [Desulfurivibrio alkaliphilus AHT 2]